ncbi:hypothetical protein PAHAL_6G162800 [Panicum hallii]|uniref:Uncharacterized protein n=1 Tax=Panicum hallii TaxID=206008 RepID=A0A2T8IGF8_9POAL|nr:hypothetical protein PAHAL_6G162800 [Panicum hallii]
MEKGTADRRRVTSSSISDRHSRRSPPIATGVAGRAGGSGDSIIQGDGRGRDRRKRMRKVWLPLGMDHRASRWRKAPAAASDRAPSCTRMKAAGRQRHDGRPRLKERRGPLGEPVPGSELPAR